MYSGYVTTIKNVRPHPNADRLQLGECFGNTVCVNLDYTEGQMGVYFPTDGQLSMEFCKANNLLRLYDEEGHSIPGGGYMDPKKRNVSAIRLRGEKSDGLFLPLTCLESFGDISNLKPGPITVFNGHEICRKYIPPVKDSAQFNKKSRTRKKKTPIAPLFMEHIDTAQLAYNLDAFKPRDEIEITLKMHGTSQRTGYLPTFQKYKRTLMDKILRRPGTPVYDWGYVSGTRRTVLENYEGGFYGNDKFREEHHRAFEGKLWKGETVYYEVVGFLTDGRPIMASCDNKKLQDKDFIKQYGKTTTFSYGCEPHGAVQSDVYVYRMTMTNEDGNVIEYTPDFMRYRCEQMGVKAVPVFWRGTIPEYEPVFVNDPEEANDLAPDYTTPINAGEYVKNAVEKFYDGPDPIGKTHVREGAVVRILNRPTFTAFKHKNFSFKVLENIIKLEAEAPDMEEADEIEEMDEN